MTELTATQKQAKQSEIFVKLASNPTAMTPKIFNGLIAEAKAAQIDIGQLLNTVPGLLPVLVKRNRSEIVAAALTAATKEAARPGTTFNMGDFLTQASTIPIDLTEIARDLDQNGLHSSIIKTQLLLDAAKVEAARPGSSFKLSTFLEMRDENNKTKLMKAVLDKNPSVAIMLIDAGADIHAGDTGLAFSTEITNMSGAEIWGLHKTVQESDQFRKAKNKPIDETLNERKQFHSAGTIQGILIAAEIAEMERAGKPAADIQALIDSNYVGDIKARTFLSEPQAFDYLKSKVGTTAYVAALEPSVVQLKPTRTEQPMATPEQQPPSPARWTSIAGIVEVTLPNGKTTNVSVPEVMLGNTFTPFVLGDGVNYRYKMPSDPQPAPGENLVYFYKTENGSWYAPKLGETRTVIQNKSAAPYYIEDTTPSKDPLVKKEPEPQFKLSFNRPPTQEVIDSVPSPQLITNINFNIEAPEIDGGFLKRDKNDVLSQVPLIVSPGLDFSRFINLQGLTNDRYQGSYEYTDGSFDLSGFANCKNLKTLNLKIPGTAFQGNELLANHTNNRVLKFYLNTIAEGKAKASQEVSAATPTPAPIAPAKKYDPTADEKVYIDAVNPVLERLAGADAAAEIRKGLEKVFGKTTGNDDINSSDPLEAPLAATLKGKGLMTPGEFFAAKKPAPAK